MKKKVLWSVMLILTVVVAGCQNKASSGDVELETEIATEVVRNELESTAESDKVNFRVGDLESELRLKGVESTEFVEEEMTVEMDSFNQILDEISIPESTIEFEFDGVRVSLPEPISTFEKMGWYCEDENVWSTKLEPGVMSSCFFLVNEKYPELSIEAFVTNESDVACSVGECSVSAISLSILNQEGTVESYPSIMYNGVEYGDSIEDIKATLGKPKQEAVTESVIPGRSKQTAMFYESLSEGKFIGIYAYEDIGMTYFSASVFR